MSINSFCYYGVAAIGVILFTITYFKAKTVRCFLLLLGMIGVGYTIEFVIFTLFDCYVYYPKILHDPYYDSNIGAMTSNLLALPAAATFIAFFDLGWTWIFFVTAFFVGIEKLFLDLGIFCHNWWNLWFTTLGLPCYFFSAKLWFPFFMRPMKGTLHFVSLFFIAWPILSTFQFLPIAIFKWRTYTTGLFRNTSHDTTFVMVLFCLVIVCMILILKRMNWKYNWPKYLIVFSFIYGMHKILQKAGIMHSYVWWDNLYCVVVGYVTFLIINVLNRRLSEGPN